MTIPADNRATAGNVVLILGAGWSWCGGLPLARDLFEDGVEGYTRDASTRLQSVALSYGAWRERNPEAHSERFLMDAQRGEVSLVTPPLLRGQLAIEALRRLPWGWAVEFVQARLSNPVLGETRRVGPRYAPQLQMPTRSRSQIAFWREIQKEHTVAAVVTLNYDLLAERTLRPHRMARWPGGGFHYGGLASRVQTSPSPFGRERRSDPTPDGVIPVFKLHGSLNWVVQGTRVIIYQDVRGAFRDGGVAAIVPPLPEKQAPDWLTPIWRDAAVKLAEADEWVVVGYSLPEYDHAVRALLSTAAKAGTVRRIVLHDPAAAELASRWRQLSDHLEVVAAEPLTRG